MPQERRKRGRRAEKKRKEERAPSLAPEPEFENLYIEDHEGVVPPVDDATTFYGLLTEEESEYFRRADEMLVLNEFEDAEGRSLFIANLYKEAQGKELKIAHSQGCSRLLERLILLSTPAQLKALFQCFSGHFLTLVKHRFASHVCETLFLQAAPVVSQEMESDFTAQQEVDEDSVFASMESLFLYMFNEILPELKGLITDTFASHTVRTLLLLLSGSPVSSATALIQSRKKENISLSSETISRGSRNQISVVPQSFHEAVGKLLSTVCIVFSAEELRPLAVHQIGSPVLQIMLQLEMGLSKKERRKREKTEGTLLSKLTGVMQKDEAPTAAEDIAEDGKEWEEQERNFFQNLLYDSVGSHLAESIMRHAPKRDFNMLYGRFIRSRLGSLARNETAAFVVQRVLEKLPKEGLEEAIKEILPQVPSLVECSRVAVLKTLIDACMKQEISATPIISATTQSYDCTPAELIFKMLHLTPADLTSPPKTEAPAGKPKRDPFQLHGSLFAQTILSLPIDAASPLIESIFTQPQDTLVALCKHSQASHVVQKLLNSPTATVPNRRRLLNALKGRFVELSIDTVASHIVDACWGSPMNYRQSIAEELLRAEPQMRESYSGRAVWRNWNMDKYKTRKQQWFQLAKEEATATLEGKPIERKKTAIQMAMERHAAQKKSGFTTVANATKSKRYATAAVDMKGGGEKKRRVE